MYIKSGPSKWANIQISKKKKGGANVRENKKKVHVFLVDNTNLSFSTDPRIPPYVNTMVPNKHSCCFWISFNL